MDGWMDGWMDEYAPKDRLLVSLQDYEPENWETEDDNRRSHQVNSGQLQR